MKLNHTTRPILLLALLALPLLGSCAGPNSTGRSALFGAGLGAVAGQAIGRDTESTLLGTAIGAGAGLILGAQQDAYDRGAGYGYGYQAGYVPRPAYRPVYRPAPYYGRRQFCR